MCRRGVVLLRSVCRCWVREERREVERACSPPRRSPWVVGGRKATGSVLYVYLYTIFSAKSQVATLPGPSAWMSERVLERVA